MVNKLPRGQAGVASNGCPWPLAAAQNVERGLSTAGGSIKNVVQGPVPRRPVSHEDAHSVKTRMPRERRFVRAATTISVVGAIRPTFSLIASPRVEAVMFALSCRRNLIMDSTSVQLSIDLGFRACFSRLLCFDYTSPHRLLVTIYLSETTNFTAGYIVLVSIAQSTFLIILCVKGGIASR